MLLWCQFHPNFESQVTNMQYHIDQHLLVHPSSFQGTASMYMRRERRQSTVSFKAMQQIKGRWVPVLCTKSQYSSPVTSIVLLLCIQCALAFAMEQRRFCMVGQDEIVSFKSIQQQTLVHKKCGLLISKPSNNQQADEFQFFVPKANRALPSLLSPCYYVFNGIELIPWSKEGSARLVKKHRSCQWL